MSAANIYIFSLLVLCVKVENCLYIALRGTSDPLLSSPSFCTVLFPMEIELEILYGGCSP